MKQNIQQYLKFAFRTAILIEKQSFDFYRYAEKMVKDGLTRETFKQLAGEEAVHLREFHTLYQEFGFGNLNKLINLPPNFETPVYRALIASLDTNTQEKEALEIALREEESCIEVYTKLVSAINEPNVHHLFQQALSETRTHCKIIQAEYARVMRRDEMVIEAVYEPPRSNIQTIIPNRDDIILPGRDKNNQRMLSAPGSFDATAGHIRSKSNAPPVSAPPTRTFRIIV